jgi:penicillin-binding protein 1B
MKGRRLSPRLKWVLAVLFVVFLGPPAYIYYKYSAIVDERLRNGAFSNTSNVYAAPASIAPGDEVQPQEIVAQLRHAGYTDSGRAAIGHYRLNGDVLEIQPGPESYFSQEGVRVRFAEGKIAELISVKTNQKLQDYRLEPQLITNIVDRDREKRRLVTFAEIPKVLVNALVSAEDKHFFQHLGFDPFRITKAAMVDLKSGRKEQGASTLTMQLARNFYLEPEKKWKRKAQELLLTIIMEQKLSKQQIFESYANQVYLGRQDTYSIHGFGQGARAYFNKDIKDLTLPEAALLAGLIQRPSYFNPFRYPERATTRRNAMLKLMQENKYITADEYERAKNSPLNVQHPAQDSGDAPYFMALMTDELQSRLPDNGGAGMTHKVYTTLDTELQRDALEAVQVGMASVDKIIKARRGKKSKDTTLPQVALVALDPHTGEIRAIVGGRNYSDSQLNHAISKRQPGSVFKPFVYAAALNTAITGDPHPFTPASTIVDQPTVFKFGNQTYEPGNFGDRFYGRVTLEKALAHSMNLATVSLAEKVGYNKVVDLAKRCGINDNVQPTPAVALGAYEATPLEIAGAYTAFANSGVFVRPTFLASVRSADGQMVVGPTPEKRQALDPRVAYLMVQMMQEVMRSGTAAGVRSRGFKAEAAGKTGTSRDGWFAGFTPNLLCIVWVGFDDNRELDLEGAKSALPIWTEFMKRAVKRREFARPFPPAPPGVVQVKVDASTGLRAGPYCDGPIRAEYFIAGTEPRSTCEAYNPDEFAGIDEVFGNGVAPRNASMQPTPARPAVMRVPAEGTRARMRPEDLR